MTRPGLRLTAAAGKWGLLGGESHAGVSFAEGTRFYGFAGWAQERGREVRGSGEGATEEGWQSSCHALKYVPEIMPSRGPAGLAEFSNGMERPGVFQTVCLPAECFSLCSLLLLSVSLSCSLIFYARPASILFCGGLFKRRSLPVDWYLEIFARIPTSCIGFEVNSNWIQFRYRAETWNLVVRWYRNIGTFSRSSSRNRCLSACYLVLCCKLHFRNFVFHSLVAFAFFKLPPPFSVFLS